MEELLELLGDRRIPKYEETTAFNNIPITDEYVKHQIISEDKKEVKAILKRIRTSGFHCNSTNNLITVILENKALLDKISLVKDGSYLNTKILLKRNSKPYILIYSGIKTVLGDKVFDLKFDYSEIEMLNLITDRSERVYINIRDYIDRDRYRWNY
jgi:hypothetical protein